MIGYVYISENVLNGMRYIGKHKSTVFDEDYKGSGSLITKAINKYGKDNFSVKILEECDTLDELNSRETYYITLYDAVNSNNFYNKSYGKEGESWEGVNKMYRENPTLSKIDKYNWSHQAKGKIWIYKDNTGKYIEKEDLYKYINKGWTKGRPSEIISKGNKKRDWNNSNFVRRTKCELIHNNINIIFNSVGELYNYCKQKYDLSCGTVKTLLNTEEYFNPKYNRLEKARGLKLKRI